MIRYGQFTLLTLALLSSAATALCQKTESKGKLDEGKTKDPIVTPTQQRIAPDVNTVSDYLANFKHTPNVPFLMRIIDLDLRHSTVREAAEAITQASGVTIRVDNKVPTDARLEVTAIAIPLTTVLETIALRTKLSIVPDGNNVLLKSWPVLEVNGQKQVLVGRNNPWSDEWDILAKPMNGIIGVPSGMRPIADNNRMTPLPVYFAYLPQQNGNDVQRTNGVTSFVPAWSGVSLTALNDHSFVVAEPALGPKGENGVQLTVYRLDGAQLRVVSTTFHKLALEGKAVPSAPFQDGRKLNNYERGLLPNPGPDLNNPFSNSVLPDKETPASPDKKAGPSNPPPASGTKAPSDGKPTPPQPDKKSSPSDPAPKDSDPKNTTPPPGDKKPSSGDPLTNGKDPSTKPTPEVTTPPPPVDKKPQ